MEKDTIGLNKETYKDQPVMRVSPRRLSLRDTGLIHLFDELDLEVRQSLIDYLDRMGLTKESGMLVIPSSRHYFYDADDMKGIRTVITLRQLNHIREIRDFLKQITGLLPLNSNFIGCFIDNRMQNGAPDKQGNMPGQISDKAEVYENGIESRIPFINRMYSFIDSRTNRYLTRRSVSNLLKESGLVLVGMTEINGLTYFHTRKDKPAA
ncbi:MAG: hypothetical protein KDB91_12530 [Bacteroidales bacterium]|jgi:hypothetical protein|nr:hypothetical protein [Bacteroidales bacterium]NLD63788.1 hypothetical protein [Bacteroidales bacterium]HNT92369.1 hypothetical protein [Bacteroidales bacterium]HOO66498.1 hypothetical protein [Bacteroidales bacterium]HPE23356.1 hypothetical protein [Bacteroidales bacterium]